VRRSTGTLEPRSGMTLSSYVFCVALLLSVATYISAAMYYFRARPLYVWSRGFVALIRDPFARASKGNYVESGILLIHRARISYFISVVSIIFGLLTAFLGLGR
jgi:hypothetical protein